MIIDTNTLLEDQRIQGAFNQLDSKIFNKSLLEHHVEYFKQMGATELYVLTDRELPEELRDGARWGIEMQVAAEFQAHWNNSGDEWGIFPANYLFRDAPLRDAEAGIVRENDPAASAFFRPFALQLDGLSRGKNFNARNLLNLAGRNPHAQQALLRPRAYAAESYSNLWNLTFQLAEKDVHKHNPAGYPHTDTLWRGVDSKVSETVEQDGFVLMGRNTKVGKNVTLKGLVVIGDNVVVDNNACLEDTLVLDNTYVGKETKLTKAVADGSVLYRADLDTVMRVEDAMLLRKI